MAIAILLIIVAIWSLVWYYFGENISSAFSKNATPRDIAIQMAYKEFKRLGEKNIKKEEFEVININQDGEGSYYISSKENSIQIKKEDLKIIRINNVKFE